MLEDEKVSSLMGTFDLQSVPLWGWREDNFVVIDLTVCLSISDAYPISGFKHRYLAYGGYLRCIKRKGQGEIHCSH